MLKVRILQTTGSESSGSDGGLEEYDTEPEDPDLDYSEDSDSDPVVTLSDSNTDDEGFEDHRDRLESSGDHSLAEEEHP